MASFLTGLANQVGSENELQQKGMLEMALLSKRMELEAQNRQAEMEKAHQLSLVPGEQLGSVLKSIRTGNTSGLNGQALPEGLAQGAEAATGMGLRAEAMLNRPMHIVTKPDQNNVITAGFQDPMTGQWIGQPQQTLDPSAQRELQKVDTATQNASNMVNGIMDRAKSILPTAPAGVPINKLDAFWQSRGMPTNSDLKAFTDSLGALSAQYIKDTTGMAPRSLDLMRLDTAAFPSVSDDFPSALRKTQILLDTAQNKAATAHTVYDPKNIVPSPFHPMQKGAQAAQAQADPYGGMSLQEKLNLLSQKMSAVNGKQNGPK